MVPEEEAKSLERKHGIRIEAPITLEEVEERAAGEPQSNYGEALLKWRRRLKASSKEEFVEKTIGRGWKVKGLGKKLDGKQKAAAIGYSILRKCIHIWGEMDEFR